MPPPEVNCPLCFVRDHFFFSSSNSPPPPLIIPGNRCHSLFPFFPSCQCRRLPIILFLATAHQFPTFLPNTFPHTRHLYPLTIRSLTIGIHFPPFISDYNSLSICFQPQPIRFPTIMFNVFPQSLHQYHLRVKIRPVPSNIPLNASSVAIRWQALWVKIERLLDAAAAMGVNVVCLQVR